MGVTLQQSRILGEGHGCGTAPQRILRDANTMRATGTRIEVANKNIGYYKYSFNPLQVSFMPEMYRPPPQTVQDFTTSMIKRDS